MKKKIIDSFGRQIDYLRVSITDRCNLRCIYCMPEQGVPWKPHENILSFEEIIRIVTIMASLGVRCIKVTGGEPLLRKGAASFLKNLKTIPGIEKVTLTTNGLLLGEYLQTMDQDFLPDGINISLDALKNERYRQITRSENARPENILSLIDCLLEKDITVKINCVLIRSVNEQEIIPLVSLAKNKNIIVRFIELMPIGSASNMQPVTGAEVSKLIESVFGALSPSTDISGNGPAVYYSLANFSGKVGFINAITHGFCETCNRLRLTSEGFLKLCLSNDLGLDLRNLIRSGIDDNEIIFTITELIKNKPRFHSLSDFYGTQENPFRHDTQMSEIGG